MGVKGLWNLFGPYCERKSLYEIRGEKVAVDLSGWVCDSQNVADHHVQPRLYLRNLFFRTTYLLMENITPVFVLEGEAPLAKRDVMTNRNLIQFKGLRQNHKRVFKKSDGKRKRFSGVLTQCENLLNSIGLECIQGIGEAEAMCAHLNAIGAVSAVVSQDSDCFVYGAVRVYRNFSVSNAGNNSTNSGSVDVYDINNIKKSLDIGRNKMVTLALLCGCDYNGNGVEGVGYSNAVNFLSQHSEDTILERLKAWSTNPHTFEKMNKLLEDTNKCSGCGHLGNIRSHTKTGCRVCNTYSGCDQSSYKEYRNNVKTELAIRRKALESTSSFPDTDLIEEFLIDKEEIPNNFRPRWKRPDLIKFVKIMIKYLGWTEYYCVEKFLPVMTRWQLLNITRFNKRDNISLLVNQKDSEPWIVPLMIKKKRNPKGIACFEVIWHDPDGYFEGLVPDEQLIDGSEKLWTTIERQDLMEAAYPDVVEAFLATKKTAKKKNNKKCNKSPTKPKKNRKTTKISNLSNYQNNEIDKLDVSMHNLTLENTTGKPPKRKVVNDVSFKAKRKRIRSKKIDYTKQKKLDSFLKLNSSKNTSNISTKSTVWQKSSICLLNDVTKDSFNDEDLSNIIDGILNRDEENSMLNKLKQIPIENTVTPVKPIIFNKFDNSFNINDDFCSTPVFNKNKKRISYFFECLDEKYDAFEKSLDLKNTDCGSTDDSIELIEIKLCKNNTPIKQSTHDKSCATPYTPLIERIRRLKEKHC